MVAAPRQAWRPFIAPVAFLLAATLAVAIVRAELRHHSSPSPSAHRQKAAHEPVPKHQGPAFYIVRAGDTMTAIAARTKLTTAKLEQLNPNVSPTALFIGERIHLR